MARSRQQKEEHRSDLEGKFAKAHGAFLAEYRGISAENLRALRVGLRDSQSEFKVVKNRVAKKAIEGDEKNQEALSEHLKGPLGIIYLYGDVAQGAKAVLDFSKANKEFKLLGGVLDGSAVDTNGIDAISSLPSKEVLIAKMLGSLKAPHQGMVGVLSGVHSKLVRAIKAISDTKN